MKLRAAGLAAVFLLGLVPAVGHAQDFSADVVYLAPGSGDAPATAAAPSSHPDSKIYVSKDKMRLETRGLTGTVLVVNGGEQTAYALFPARKAYQPLGSGPSEYFRVDNAEDACPDWQKASAHKIVCEKVGQEAVDGRQTVKYRNKGAPDNATAAVWIDETLKFVVKWEGGATGAVLRNIKEGQQSAELFSVPSDYKPLKPQKGSKKGFSERSQ
jgi:hypothetical protein